MQTCSNSPLCVCFGNLSTVKSLSYAQLTDYNASWETFRRVQLYNSNISTQRGEGATGLNYYQFFSQQEQAAYRTGAVLFFTYLGYSNVVQNN